MKNFKNNFAVTGFIATDAKKTQFQNATVARCAISVSRQEKVGEETQRKSALLNIEAWRKNENAKEIDLLKKGTLLTIEGYFKPEEWEETNQETGEVTKRSRVVFAATKIYEPEEVEDKKD